MAELTFVRHAQAGQLAGHYDTVSDLGREQARLLGDYLAAQEEPFDRLARGGLTRHALTMEILARSLPDAPEPEVLPGLNEYDFANLAKAYFVLHPRPDDFRSDRRVFFRVLRQALLAWSRDELPAEHLAESWQDFTGRIAEALADLSDPAKGERVLAVTSGGALSMMMAQVLGLTTETAIGLNLQTKNSGISRFIFTGRSLYLHSFNGAPHLETPARRHLVTYS
ncbi:MAG: histidine phosphatase family protein [Rhodospirillales bacterium]